MWACTQGRLQVRREQPGHRYFHGCSPHSWHGAPFSPPPPPPGPEPEQAAEAEAAALGGGLGNIIDRVFRGYVVDLFATDFIQFPVFNVADCFITCGAIGLLVHLAFWNRSFWRDDKKMEKRHDSDV